MKVIFYYLLSGHRGPVSTYCSYGFDKAFEEIQEGGEFNQIELCKYELGDKDELGNLLDSVANWHEYIEITEEEYNKLSEIDVI